MHALAIDFPRSVPRTESSPRRRRSRLLGLVVLDILAVAAAGGIGFAAWDSYDESVCARFRTVVASQVFRSSQPSPDHLREWQATYGIQTIINLRGERDADDYRAERRACAELGLRLIDLEWSAVRLPGPAALSALLNALRTSERPILIHCAEGKDRSGVASTIAAMVLGGQDYDTARLQIGSKYRRQISYANGVLALLRGYEQHCDENGTGRGGWTQFACWLSSHGSHP